MAKRGRGTPERLGGPEEKQEVEAPSEGLGHERFPLTDEQRNLCGVNDVVRGEAPADADELDAAPEPTAPPLFGLALTPIGRGKYLVVRGRLVDFESLSPTRHGEHTGESQHAAVARLMEEMRRTLGRRT